MTSMNEQELVKKALAELKKQGAEIELSKGITPEATRLNAFDLIMQLTKIQRAKEDKEYQELLKNGNGNGNGGA